MQPTDQPLADPQVVLRDDFADRAILFHPLTGEAVGVNPVGLTIWKLLDGQHTLAKIAAQVQAQCADAPPTVLADTLAFVDDLQRRLLVRVKDECR